MIVDDIGTAHMRVNGRLSFGYAGVPETTGWLLHVAGLPWEKIIPADCIVVVD